MFAFRITLFKRRAVVGIYYGNNLNALFNDKLLRSLLSLGDLAPLGNRNPGVMFGFAPWLFARNSRGLLEKEVTTQGCLRTVFSATTLRRVTLRSGNSIWEYFQIFIYSLSG